MGLKHASLRQLLVTLLVEEGQRTWRAQGVEPNISQLSVTTGLNRKAITSRQRTLADAAAAPEMSAAAKTLTRWVQLLDAEPALSSIPIASNGTGISFEAIAREASRGDLHHRAILDELVRLDLVQQRHGQAMLTSRSFVPRNDLGAMLGVFGDNAHDHLAAGVHNVLRAGAPMLERSIYATGVLVADCADIEQLVRERWTTLHHELADRMTSAVDAAGPTATARIRVGIYMFTGPINEDIESRRDDSPTPDLPEHRERTMITNLLRTALATSCLALLFACGGGGGGGVSSVGAVSGGGVQPAGITGITGSTGDAGGTGDTAGASGADGASGGTGSSEGSTSTAAAEGSGDGSGVGSGGTGATADAVGIGSVDGLGSVFLNGLRYNTDTAQFSVEDASAIELGMSAKVTGPVSSDFTRGTAIRVESAAEFRGPVSGIDTAAGTFVVMGTTVSTDPATVWADSSGLTAVPLGATVQVWGLPGAPGTLRATRVAQVSNPAAIATGTVENLNPLLRTFSLGALTVNYAAATLIPGLDATTLTNGALVRVRANGTGSALELAAASVQRWYAVPQTGSVSAQLAGIVTSFAGLQRFQLLGIAIDASSAQITGGPSASIGNGVKIEVAGTLSGGVLRATRLKIKHVPGTGGPSSFALDGTVGAFTSSASFRIRGQPVDASAPTVVFVNGSAASLRNGVKLSVTGSQVRDGVLLADRIVFD